MLTQVSGEMRMLNQIISKGLHTTDGECLQYTTNLMDKLEQVRVQVLQASNGY